MGVAKWDAVNGVAEGGVIRTSCARFAYFLQPHSATPVSVKMLERTSIGTVRYLLSVPTLLR